ncbi:MAG: hypothetical protein IJT65_01360 [Eubacterium sp.]|nr:hypothetical protein [Eubacterium sp.]
MKGKKLTNEAKYSVFIICIIVAAYIAQKALEFYVVPSKTVAIVSAMIHTLILASAIYVISKSKEPFWGLLAALYGYKMLPVPILILWSQSADAYILYFFVSKVAMIIFAVLIYRLYEQQGNNKEIKAVPILAAMFAVPFFNGIASEFTAYFLKKTGSMLFGFFSQYACYIAACAIILFLAYISSEKSLKLIVGFEVVAVCVNVLRTLGKITVGVIQNTHISKSLYGWIAVYVLVLVASIVSLKLKEKENIKSLTEY